MSLDEFIKYNQLVYGVVPKISKIPFPAPGGTKTFNRVYYTLDSLKNVFFYVSGVNTSLILSNSVIAEAAKDTVFYPAYSSKYMKIIAKINGNSYKSEKFLFNDIVISLYSIYSGATLVGGDTLTLSFVCEDDSNVSSIVQPDVFVVEYDPDVQLW